MSPTVTAPMRLALICVGATCVGLGLVGALLPVLPTTPFMLLAAACFARSSDRLHRAILDNRTFGPLVRAYRDDGSIPRSAKRRALVIIPFVFVLSIATVDVTAVRVALVATAIGLLVYLSRLPTRDG